MSQPDWAAFLRMIHSRTPVCRLVSLNPPGTVGFVNPEAVAADGLFPDLVLPLPRLIIVGGGHVGLALAPVAQAAGFAVTVLDDRPDFAAPDRFPGATLLCTDPAAGIDSLQPGPTDYLVIASRSHETDLACLKAAVYWPLAYIGLMGSRRKVTALHHALLASPVATPLNRLRAPVGLDIGAETPAEIAVAIVAELIGVRRGGSCLPLTVAPRQAAATSEEAPLTAAGNPEGLAVWTALGEALAVGQSCALATVVRVKGSTPRSAGAHMLLCENGRLVGTIGGGGREAEVIQAARQCLAERQNLLYRAEYLEERNSLCGGVADLVIECVL